MHVYKELCNVNQFVTSNQEINRPLPWFFASLKPVKRQDLLQKGQKGRNAFQTGAEIHFSKKKNLGVRGTLKCCYFHCKVLL